MEYGTAYTYLVIYDRVSYEGKGKVRKWVLGSVDVEGALPVVNGATIEWNMSDRGLPKFEVEMEMPLDVGRRLLDSTIFSVGNIGVLHWGYSGRGDYFVQGLLLPNGLSFSIDQGGVSGTLSFAGQDFRALSKVLFPLNLEEVKTVEDWVRYLIEKVVGTSMGREVRVEFSDAALDVLHKVKIPKREGAGVDDNIRKVLDRVLEDYGLGYTWGEDIAGWLGVQLKGGRGVGNAMKGDIGGVGSHGKKSAIVVYVFRKDVESVTDLLVKDRESFMRRFVFFGEFDEKLRIYPMQSVSANYEGVYFTDVDQQSRGAGMVYMDEYGDMVVMSMGPIDVLKKRIDELLKRLNIDRKQFEKAYRAYKAESNKAGLESGKESKDGKRKDRAKARVKGSKGREGEVLDFGMYYLHQRDIEIKEGDVNSVGVGKTGAENAQNGRGVVLDRERRKGKGQAGGGKGRRSEGELSEKHEEKELESYRKLLNQLYSDMRQLERLQERQSKAEEMKKKSKPVMVRGYPMNDIGYNRARVEEYLRRNLEKFGLKINVTTVGITGMVPGEYVLVDNLGLMLDGVYMVRGLKHTISNGSWSSEWDGIRIGGPSLLEQYRKINR